MSQKLFFINYEKLFYLNKTYLKETTAIIETNK
jgi:hypothetical protein